MKNLCCGQKALIGAGIIGLVLLLRKSKVAGVGGIGNAKYKRVIPRDFFNESKLLKCMGFLALRILDNEVPEGINIKISENGNPFKISHYAMWDILYVSNYAIEINGQDYICGTTINSKEPFPFYCIVEDEQIEVEIFDSNGNFSTDFIEQFTTN